ncbi:tetratricopeptide repeat protein [Aeromonas caviae]|uniref:tetratricopeptide repeat protein n=1 Tax=Aeromonas caviae TaxID=648 RepID=UPI001432D1BC|nr:DUF2971 domain-containing protein [Aeromonas caviae]NKD16201.1 DUF2971 domain-containing protein [Aeromonas caviae]
MDKLAVPEEIAALIKEAEAGNKKALFNLGVKYQYGRGVEKNAHEAVSWYSKAAEQGHARAQCNLGLMYEKGQGVEQSHHEAVFWYRKSAEQGYARAQCNLGFMYERGQGVEQSYHEAVLWYRKSAEQGYPRAQCNLGVMYQKGHGVEPSNHEAVIWYRKSAEQEYDRAQHNLGLMYRNGYGIEKSDSEAVFWFRKAAEQEYASAQCSLGFMYEYGRGVEQSDHQAVIWYRKAADQDNPNAQCNLGFMYQSGRGVEPSNHEAIFWYRKAAEQKYARAQFRMGLMYRDGRGVEKSDHEAIAWYRKAAEQEYPNAQCNLGFMYENGRGVKKDYSKAAALYRKAVKNGNAQASINLGVLYTRGDGVRKSYARAQVLFRKAAIHGSPQLRFTAIEYQDQANRYALAQEITTIRYKILTHLKVKPEQTMTHYTSLVVGNALLLEKSSLRLGHINSLNDPNEGKLLWQYLGHVPVEGKPAFVGCFLPEDDSLNMWRFYSKNHHNDDACGCAITFNTNNFFDFSLLPEKQGNSQQDEKITGFTNTGKSPRESASFYRIVYISDGMTIHNDDESGTLKILFNKLKKEVDIFLGVKPDNKKLKQLSRLLGPLPYLLKDADYKSEKEHRIIVTHLEYGAKEIQCAPPELDKGTQPRLYLELHRVKHLDPVRHVTLGPKAPHQEMMIPYWHHKLMSDFSDQLESKEDFYIKSSKCAYQ